MFAVFSSVFLTYLRTKESFTALSGTYPLDPTSSANVDKLYYFVHVFDCDNVEAEAEVHDLLVEKLKSKYSSVQTLEQELNFLLVIMMEPKSTFCR